MSPEVVWTWSAEADLQRHFNWREDRSEGSGIELLARVEKAAELLLRFPRIAAVWRSPVRRLILKRSTLGLFDVPEPRGIVVIAVADLRQDPERLWQEIQSRLP